MFLLCSLYALFSREPCTATCLSNRKLESMQLPLTLLYVFLCLLVTDIGTSLV